MVSLPGRRDAAPYNERLRIRWTGCLPLVLLPGRRDAAPYNERLRIRRTGCLPLVLLPGRRDAAPYKEMLRIRRTWLFIFGAAAERRGRRSLHCNAANSPGGGGLPLVLLRGAPGSARPTWKRFGCDGPLSSSKAHSPIPSPSGGGCRPQGRQERENVTGPQCGNDRRRGDMRTILPPSSGQVLPLPSSASRGIGGCHLPPLGEGMGGVHS